MCVASWGVVPPLPCPAPPPPRTPAPGDSGATPLGQTLAGGWRAQSNGVSFILLFWDCREVAETWREAAHIIWNLLGMTKGSVSCMLATFQGLPRWV